MKKSLVTVVLLFAMVAFAVAQAPAGGTQQGAAGAQAGQTTDPAQTGAAPQQKKEIKDQAEYQAYLSAIQQQDPNAKASALEGFIQQYPNSVVKVDAMEALMGAYQQAGNAAKLTDTAQRIVQVEPKHVPSLAVLTAVRRGEGVAQPPQQGTPLLVQARDFAQRGLEALQTWQKPEGVDQAAFDKQKRDLTGLFQGAIGLAHAAEGNSQQAVPALRASVEINPMDFHTIYALGRALLEIKPKENQSQVEGIFFVTRAAALLQGQPQQQMLAYARNRYSVFHGGEDGFETVMKAASQNPLPPPGFTIQPGPTPAEQAAKMAAKPANQLSFDEFQFIFQNAAPADAQRVWDAIKGKPIAFQAKVVDATAQELRVAATYENAQKNVADVTIAMTDVIPAKMMPKVGADAAVTGTPVSYTAEPFMITMDNGKLAVIKGTAAANAAKGTTAKTGTAKTGTKKGTTGKGTKKP